MNVFPYWLATACWATVLLLSGCSTRPVAVQLQPVLHFRGVSARETAPLSPLMALCYDANGILYTLVRGSGRITAFAPEGRELRSFVVPPQARRAHESPVEAVALGTGGGKVFTLDAGNQCVQEWESSGLFLRRVDLKYPLSAGDSAFNENGEIYHNTEGFTEDSLIVKFDRAGNVTEKIGQIPAADTALVKDAPYRQILARGGVPRSLQHSVLIAPGPGGRIYTLHRTRPLLRCYIQGKLALERKFTLPELGNIALATRVRNRLLTVPDAYIPYSYWADLAVDELGNIYILLALQPRQTIYRLDPHGENAQKFIGEYGKGHLLAVRNGRLAVGDAAQQKINIYALPSS